MRRNVGGRRRCEVLSEGENSRARCFLSIAHASGTSESASERAARWRERGRQARAGKEGESEKKRGGSNVKKGKRKVEQKGGKNSLLPASLACLLFSFSASVLARSHLFCFIRTHSFFVVFDLSFPPLSSRAKMSSYSSGRDKEVRPETGIHRSRETSGDKES